MTALAVGWALYKWLNLYTSLRTFVASYALLLVLMGRWARKLMSTSDLGGVTKERIDWIIFATTMQQHERWTKTWILWWRVMAGGVIREFWVLILLSFCLVCFWNHLSQIQVRSSRWVLGLGSEVGGQIYYQQSQIVIWWPLVLLRQ